MSSAVLPAYRGSSPTTKPLFSWLQLPPTKVRGPLIPPVPPVASVPPREPEEAIGSLAFAEPAHAQSNNPMNTRIFRFMTPPFACLQQCITLAREEKRKEKTELI